MKIHFLHIIFIVISLIINSCVTNNIQISNATDEIEAIKFMGTITTQSRSVDEKAFWYFENEHVRLKIKNNRLIEEVKSLKKHNLDNFDEYNYAFIVKKGKSIDTLYSDKSLNTWILKKNKKEIYYYDEEGKIAENLRNIYSFFYDCW